MHMQCISVSTLLLFSAYLTAVDELSKLTFKPKIFPYFAGRSFLLTFIYEVGNPLLEKDTRSKGPQSNLMGLTSLL